MRKSFASLTVLCAMMILPAASSAQGSACDSLTGDKKALAQKIIDSQSSSFSKRLRENVCHHAAEGEDEEKILRRLKLRQESLDAGVQATAADIDGFAIAGDRNAQVTVVVYACSRCPFCSRLLPQLHQAVTGKLKGKVRLVLKPFPLKSHALSKEGGLALLSAMKLGHFWDFTLKMYGEFNEFSVEKLPQWAAAVGMNTQQFQQVVDDPKTLEQLVALKKEGLAIGVEATPTLFINGRMYSGFLDIYEVTDFLEEVFEKNK